MTTSKSSRRWIALAALCVAVFMSLLDVTIVNVALPTIQRDLNESYTDLQWIINAYTLSYAMFLLLASKFGDLFGRKRLFLITLVIFTAGSLASALSQTALALNLARMVQGIGGAGMMSLSMTIVAATFSGQERGTAFGIWSSVVGVATAMGPLLGGYLIQIANWRAIFMINLPIGLIALGVAWAFVDESHGVRSETIDWLGMVVSTVMIFCLVYGLVQKETHQTWTWVTPNVAGYLVAGVLLLGGFLLLERYRKDPMIDLTIFKSAAFDGTIVAAFCLGAGLYAFFTYMTVWMQNYLGYTAVETGVRQLAIGLFSLFFGPVAGALSNRLPKRWLIGAGLLLIAGGLFEIERVVSLHVTYLDFVVGFMLMGLGNATVNPPLSAAAMDSVELKHVGMASGVMNVFRQLGISFGIVILGLRLSSGYTPGVAANVNALALPSAAKHGLITGLNAAGPIGSSAVITKAQHLLAPQQVAQLKQAVFGAYNAGYRNVLLTAIGFALVGAVLALTLIRRPARQK